MKEKKPLEAPDALVRPFFWRSNSNWRLQMLSYDPFLKDHTHIEAPGAYV